MHPSDALLNDFVDDEVTAAERAPLVAHLAACDTCRALVEDLREVRRLARQLPALPPPAAVWPRLQQHLPSSASGTAGSPDLGPSSVGHLLYRSRTSWLAAAALLLLATIVGLRFGPGLSAPDSAAAGDGLARQVEAELEQAEVHYQRAIAGLEQIATSEQGELDPPTAALLRKNLAVIDQAISESRAALKVEPESEPAQQSLLESFKQKVALLQDTVALINEMRKGDDAGAARVVSGMQ